MNWYQLIAITGTYSNIVRTIETFANKIVKKCCFWRLICKFIENKKTKNNKKIRNL